MTGSAQPRGWCMVDPQQMLCVLRQGLNLLALQFFHLRNGDVIMAGPWSWGDSLRAHRQHRAMAGAGHGVAATEAGWPGGQERRLWVGLLGESEVLTSREVS